MVAESFPRKLAFTKNFHKKFFSRKFFMVAKSLPRREVLIKKFRKKLFAEHFLWLQNHFLEKSF